MQMIRKDDQKKRQLLMPGAIEFPFSDDEALPTIPITLSYANFSISANAFGNSGSTVNLLPYEVGYDR
jgi:hypothetical protein